MPLDAPRDPADATSNGWLEDLVASALEALDRAGEAGLQALLAGHPEHRQQVEDLVARFRGTGLLARDARDDIPERLGEFRLQKRLGGGGMGVVFLAEQESLRRTVALKIVRPDLLLFAGTRERFQREIDVIARLSHPAIVPIVATGEHEGMPWYAMQLIHGCSADEAVKRLRGRDAAQLRGIDLWRAIHGSDEASSQLDRSQFAGEYWEACVRLVRQAALGLEHAHREGVVHRDVKPSNLMLTPDGRALLLDFGLARVHGDPKLTRTGGEPGSPAYMAPEQLRGQTADERADVYSLAATLFQLLDLRAPFAAEDGEALRAQILEGTTAIGNRSAPRELRLVLSVAMDLDRDRRYATAAAFAADLDAVLARRPIRARPLPRHVRAQRWLHRHRTASALLIAAAVLAVVLPTVLAWQQAKSLAALAVEKQRVERGRDQALAAVQVFLTKFASGNLAALPGGRRIASQLLERANAQIEGLAADVDASLLRPHETHVGRWLVGSLRLAGRVDEAIAKARSLFALWPESPDVAPQVAYFLAATRGELLRIAVDGTEIRDLDALLELADRELLRAATDTALDGEVASQRANLSMNKAAFMESKGRDDEALDELRRAVDELSARVGTVPGGESTLAVLRNRLWDALFRHGDLEGVQRQCELVLAKLSPKDDPALGPADELVLRAHAQWGLARVAMQRQRWPAAASLYHDAVQLAEHRLYAYPDDGDAVVTFAKVATESAQVDRQCGADAAPVNELLERARRLLLRDRGLLTRDTRTYDSCCVNLQVLSEQYWSAQDGTRLAGIARDLASVGAADARRLSMAAWRFVQAAEFLDSAGDDAAAAACDDEALAALVACEQRGWYGPTPLDSPPFVRIASRPGFAALLARHPLAESRRESKQGR
ncbi:MAG TPA: serine/threonine-protein kinase [Planctomycetota bacterium]|nr:serine/threonine-protein kinase [Planctomycetota bacterium]